MLLLLFIGVYLVALPEVFVVVLGAALVIVDGGVSVIVLGTWHCSSCVGCSVLDVLCIFSLGFLPQYHQESRSH